MRRLLLIIGPGLLPLWVAIFYVLYKGLAQTPPPGYWDQAPDLLYYAMPASVVTILITLAITDAVERRHNS